MISNGFILDNGIKVGDFDNLVEECYGDDVSLYNLKIALSYFDIVKMTSIGNLAFVLVNKDNKVVNKIGCGLISGSAFVSDKFVFLKKAVLFKRI